MPRICVWPTKFVEGWDGDLSRPFEQHPVLDVRAALEMGYDTDAHFTCGVAADDHQPRLNKWSGAKSTLPRFRELGIHVKFDVVAVDVDRPDGPDPDVWWHGQLACLNESPAFKTAGWYRTRGGYRLVWTLPAPIEPEDYERVQRRVYGELAYVGVKVDHLPDWTRCFRLPRVKRDGEIQSYPMDLSRLGHLDVKALRVPEEDAIAKMAHANPESRWEVDFDQGRNKSLFKLAVTTLRAAPDMPDDYLETFITSIHDAKCPDPLPDGELRRIIDNARKYRPEPTTVLSADTTNSDLDFQFGPRRQVLISPGEMVRAMDETLAIMAENRGAVYSMGGGLMRLKRDIEGFLVFDEIPKPALRATIERMVEYCKVGKHGLSPLDVPRDLIDMIATLPDYKSSVWRLQEIINTPTLAPDGTPILKRGYHEPLELYLDCPENLEDLDLTNDPQICFNRVADLLIDMPFERPEHKAVAMCSFITPVVRSAIDGPVPLVIFDSSVRGSGKTTLADLTSLIATGRLSTVQPYVDETEFEKRVTAILQMGVRTVLIDNIDRPFGGATLDALLTSNMWTGRVLGQTKMIKFRSRAHWMATGNNIQIKGDLDRRALRCYITPNMERPEERRPEDYKYPKIREHVLFHRRQYVQDILTFVRAYMMKGCPQSGGVKGLGSFEDWSRVVRGCVMHYGMTDPVLSQDSLRQDGETTLWAQVLSGLETIFGQGEISARDVYTEAFVKQSGRAGKDVYNMMESALEELIGMKPSVRAVAYLLKKWRNRVVNGKKIVKATTRDRDKGHVYVIEAV